jgi:hypothetical protein
LLAWRNQFSRKKQEAAKGQPHQSLDRLLAHAFLHGLGRMLPDAVGIRQPQYSSSTVGDCASKAVSEVTTLFRDQQTHTEYGSPRYRGARSPELTTL